MARWTFDKMLLVAANALALFAEFEHSGFAVNADFLQTVPILAGGLLLTIVLIFYEPAWLYLVAGIGSAVLPLLVLSVFAGPQILTLSGSAEYSGALALALAVVFALVGGIGGFLRARRGASWSPAQGLGAPTGVALVLLTVLALGMGLASALAHDNATSGGGGGVGVDVPHATVALTTKDIQFSPQSLDVPVGQLVEIDIDNQDNVDHTFTYAVNGTTYGHAVPAGVITKVILKFDQPGDVPFWCVPHSPSMKGVMHVA